MLLDYRSVLSESVFTLNVFLRNVLDLRVFLALQVYFIVKYKTDSSKRILLHCKGAKRIFPKLISLHCNMINSAHQVALGVPMQEPGDGEGAEGDLLDNNIIYK